MTRLAVLSALFIISACSDPKSEVDAELARDLQLATAQPTQPAQPQLTDALLDAPAPVTPAPEPRTKSSVPTRRTSTPERRPAPVVERERPTPQPESPQPEAESPQPAAESPFRGILAGTSFDLGTRGQVCTSNLPGDKIVAAVTSAVVGENGATIPAGSSVVLEVASVTPGDTPESARISLRIRSIVVDGEAHSVDGDVAITSELERGPATANNSDKKKVIGGAIAGAVIGQIMGRDTKSTVIGAAAGAAAGTAAAAATRKYHACLPAGATARVTTTRPIIL